MRGYYKLWTAAVGGCLAFQVLAALFLRQSFGLTALSDIVQCLLLFSGTLSLVTHAIRTRGRLRLFWIFMSVGIGSWCVYQFLWVYFEVWLRTDVPDLFAGDMILFLHIVPLIGALALSPHAPQDEYAARVRHLDFALLMVWWIYLYVLIVIPWQYVVPDAGPYNRNLNLLYLIEKIALLGMVAVAWFGSKAGWKKFYANLFGACFTYAASSYFANWALGRHSYYSGSMYDIPLAVSMAWITMIGLWTEEREPQLGVPSISTAHGVWLARSGMIAAFSLPLFGTWALLDAIPLPIRMFRIVFTLMAAVLMGTMVFVRQRLLDRELLRLVTYSQESFKNLRKLQAQITESEKLASIGQLVAGAAHELNNPITAMLGYSDLLLLSKPLTPDQKDLAANIGEDARRTKSLVSSLLSFAKPSPANMTPVDVKTLLRTAAKLSKSQWQNAPPDLQIEFSEDVLLIRGDSNQLLQVFVQVIGDGWRAMKQDAGKALIISGRRERDCVIVEVTNIGSGADQINQRTPAHILSTLGMNACQSILQQHRGRIVCEREQAAGIMVRIELPLIGSGEKSSATPAPQWEVQPSS